jgi:hypothetical protein
MDMTLMEVFWASTAGKEEENAAPVAKVSSQDLQLLGRLGGV